MRERGAQRILQVVVAAGLLLATVSLAHGQRLPFPPGSTIRVANLAGVSNAAWVTGTVMSARRDFLHVDPLEPGAQFAFRLKDSMRLQVRRGRSANLTRGRRRVRSDVPLDHGRERRRWPSQRRWCGGIRSHRGVTWCLHLESRRTRQLGERDDREWPSAGRATLGARDRAAFVL